jgi:hypothetical protein
MFAQEQPAGNKVMAGATEPGLQPTMDILEARKASLAKTRKPIPMPSAVGCHAIRRGRRNQGKRRKQA